MDNYENSNPRPSQCECANRVYFRLYPSVHRRAINELGKTLQQWLLCLVFVHMILCFTSLAFVGVGTLLINLVCFAFVYSAYRSMQDFTMWAYIVCLLVATAHAIYYIF